MVITNTIEIKRDDAGRIITDTLTWSDGSVIDLTGATVILVWKDIDGTVTRKTPTVTNALNGSVQYTLLATDVDTAGDIFFEWEITFLDTSILTIPSNGLIKLIIHEDLG